MPQFVALVVLSFLLHVIPHFIEVSIDREKDPGQKHQSCKEKEIRAAGDGKGVEFTHDGSQGISQKDGNKEKTHHCGFHFPWGLGVGKL